MMKKITLLLILLTVSFGYSQVVLEDFEGAAPTLAFENGPGSATIVTDPAIGGTNGNVLEIITAASSAPWQQAELTIQGGNFIDLSGVTKIVTADVYSTTSFSMLARADAGVGGGPSAADALHGGTGWETLTFDFTNPKDGLGAPTGIYGKIFFFNLWDVAAAGGAGGWICGAPDCSIVRTTYVDNITAIAAAAPETCTDGIMNNGETEVDCGGPNCAGCPSPPVAGAPAPPNRLPSDVVSIFSDQYTDLGANLDAGFCGGGSVTEVMIGGNPTQQWNGLACQGIDFSGNRQDLTSFTNFHVDIYTDLTNLVGKVFNVKLVDFNGGGGEASSIELNFNDGTSPGVTATGQWLSLDIPIGAGTRGDIAQIVISSNLTSCWYDNLYVYKGTPLSTNDFAQASFSVFPNPSQNSWTVKTENVTMSSIKVFDILGKNVLSLSPNTSNTVIDGSNLKAGLYFAQIATATGINSVKLIKN